MCKLVQGTRGGVLFEPLHAHPLLNGQVGSGHPWGCAIRAPARSPTIPAGIVHQNGVFTADTERAVADMLYFNPKYHFDVPESIDFDKVRLIQKEVGYPYVRS